MRRKISKQVVLVGVIPPELTAQQQKFVDGILAGKKVAEAYRAAGYDCSNSLPETVRNNASRLHAHPNVVAALAAGRMAGLANTALSLDGHMSELDRLKEIALATGNVGAAVQAEQLRGKAMGHYTERVDVTTNDPQILMARLTELLPELIEINPNDKANG